MERFPLFPGAWDRLRYFIVALPGPSIDYFARYFERNIEPKLECSWFWSIRGKCPYDEVNGLTTNQSEGFNFLLKDFQNWKEVPIDGLLMSLKLIQGFREEECRRGKMGLGNYSLKSKYKQFKTDAENFQPRTLVCHPKDIVNSIRNRDFIVHDFANDLMNKHASNSRIVRAKELVAQDLIAFLPRLGAFSVMDTNEIHVVKVHLTESCSCPVRKKTVFICQVSNWDYGWS